MASSGVIVVLALAAVLTHGVRLSFVRCPNGSACPDGSTCCLRSSGLYGCCPYPFAVCCSDHQHCCPEGYHCNLSNGSCVQISTSVKEIQTLLTAMVLSPQPSVNYKAIETVQCPDRKYCQDGQTCCLLSEGRYGCCPYPHAVCCSDHASCCPEGYQCKVSAHTCIAGNLTVPMLEKVSTIDDSPPENPFPVELVPCPDRH
uniref:Putative low-density lipoprotein receptor n=1 Tax=Ixodes ricinus TaxID=34613 RepID=A0A6B0V225_IXORI